MNKNLTDAQNDYAVFLPATSGFYATFIGKQRYSNYVDPARLPASFVNGVESLNYLEPDKGMFYYHWCLYSAGHANLDLTKKDESEDMFRNRDRSTSWVLGDSGGFQIGKGVWEGEWRDPNSQEVQSKMAECIAKGLESVPALDKNGNIVKDKNGNIKTTKIDHVKVYQSQLDAAQKKREQVLAWMDALMDYGMVLDIPAWVCRSPAGIKATGISSYDEAVAATKFNNEYFIKHRNGNCKFLNVLQGETFKDADDWYDQMKGFCDPKLYPGKHFNGWAMGGQNMCDVHLVLKRLVALKFDGLLEQGFQDWMHFLGTSKLEWAVLLTDIQRAIRKYHNPNFTISFDCASPFLATANGQIYILTETKDRSKWVYRMVPSADDKKYSSDTRLFKDAVVQDKLFKKGNGKKNEYYNFESSPLIDQVQIKDICIYAPGDLNKIGKEGKTSWDSFSYAIQMGHNVWHHINAVQEANRQNDKNIYPAMLTLADANKKKFFTSTDGDFFKEIVDKIFAATSRTEADDLIEKHEAYWLQIPGTRGAVGDRTFHANDSFNAFFEVEELPVNEYNDFTQEEIENLERLTNEVRNES
jgi:hypothetical protein